MKKSELKKELEIAKATLGLAMVALRLASKNRFPSGGILSKNAADHNAIVPNDIEVEKLLNKLKANQIIQPKSQAGDYIVSDKVSPDNLSKVESTKETPLTDLANEVEIEKQANELIEHFMPLVNGWKYNYPVGLTESSKILWSLSNWNHKQAAIKIAIKHCEIMTQKLKTDPAEFEIYSNIKSQLQKMLSE